MAKNGRERRDEDIVYTVGGSWFRVSTIQETIRPRKNAGVGRVLVKTGPGNWVAQEPVPGDEGGMRWRRLTDDEAFEWIGTYAPDEHSDDDRAGKEI